MLIYANYLKTISIFNQRMRIWYLGIYKKKGKKIYAF